MPSAADGRRARPAVLRAEHWGGRGIIIALAAVVAVGAVLRLVGVDWDDGAHLHPDERYVTMVADAVEWPSSPAEYFDVERSPLSPYSTDTGRDYLYGQLPLFATKVVAAAAGRDRYDGVQLVGRVLSALVDTLSIVLVFLVGRELLTRWGPRVRDRAAVVAAGLYAASVTAVQHAHFFTMETWLVATTLLTFLLAARLARKRDAHRAPLGPLAATGAAVGLTAATKVSGLLVLAPVAIAVAASAWRPAARTRERAAALAAGALAVTVSAYIAFRLVSPYAFEHSSWLRVQPNENFRSALERQQQAIDGQSLYPPAYQWLLSDPWIDPLRNFVLWSVGVLVGLAGLAGIAIAAAHSGRALRRRRLEHGTVVTLMMLAFVAVTFAYFGGRFVHSIRYLVPLAPFFCLAAAYALATLHARSPAAGRITAAVVVGGTLLYAAAFTAVYRAPTTRVAAAAWLEPRLAAGTRVASEHWDDGLPLRSPHEGVEFVQLPVFDPDDETKLRKLYDGLRDIDWYVLSSPRAWRTIGRLPDRFPLMASFYERLRAEQLGFREAARFESEPRLLGATVSDLDAEESFWVYDHPPVIVYARDRQIPWPAFRDAVCSGAPGAPGCARPRR